MKIIKDKEFTTRNNYKIEAIPLSDVVDVSHFLDGENRYIMSFENQTILTGAVNARSTDNVQAIVTKEMLDEISENPDMHHDFKTDRSTESPIAFMSKDFIPYFVKYGNNGFLASIFGEKDKHQSEFVNEKVFDECSKPGYEFLQFRNNEDHIPVWVDASGKLYMEPFKLDYIQARLDNGEYHLDELVEHLSKRDDVVFVSNHERSYSKDKKVLVAPLKGDEEGIDSIIDDIPHYNADEERNESILVIYYPKDEDIPRILNWKSEADPKKIYNVEHFIVKNIFGGDKFLKQPVVENEENEPPKRKFKR